MTYMNTTVLGEEMQKEPGQESVRENNLQEHFVNNVNLDAEMRVDREISRKSQSIKSQAASQTDVMSLLDGTREQALSDAMVRVGYSLPGEQLAEIATESWSQADLSQTADVFEKQEEKNIPRSERNPLERPDSARTFAGKEKVIPLSERPIRKG